ncbi:sensor histidine kinase [Nonomuraea sp. NPDC050556]|uniref:sensor histidine kinase n=1 Tax=Nonomuraea sp. NPDC050556 TaxID=3364369 RepID=UPI00378C4807
MSIRLRFAVTCGAVFLLLSSVLLAGIYFLVRQSLSYRAEVLTPDTWGYYQRYSNEYELGRKRAMQVVAVYQKDTLSRVLLYGALGVLAGTGAAVGLGWRGAGRVMRPLTEVTETARKVAQSFDLSERIDYRGANDEVKELAGIVDNVLGRQSRSFEGQRRFVANASHELRTPLTINRTLVDVAVRRQDASEDVKRLGESLLIVTDRHERLIDGLLALAEGEQSVLDRRPFDLIDVVEHALDLADKHAQEREVTLHRLLDSAPVAGDPVLVERLVQNLIENGVRHNHPGGEVWVTTRRRADVAELVVANTGLKVHPYEVETIFQPFRRLHGDRISSDRGSGLGMSIVKAIAEAHDGNVVARPREEGGLTVTVELPLEA